MADYQRARDRERRNGDTGRRYPAWMVRRRGEALMAIGWTADHIAVAGGWNTGQTVNSAMGGTTYVNRATYTRMDTAYQRLSTRPGPSESTRQRARAWGFAPPAAWDDIDNEDETPVGVLPPLGCGTLSGYEAHRRRGEATCGACRRANTTYHRDRTQRTPAVIVREVTADDYDEAAVQRRLDGDHRITLTRTERHELVRRMHGWGMSTTAMSRRTGYPVARMSKALNELGLQPHELETRAPVPQTWTRKTA